MNMECVSDYLWFLYLIIVTCLARASGNLWSLDVQNSSVFCSPWIKAWLWVLSRDGPWEGLSKYTWQTGPFFIFPGAICTVIFSSLILDNWSEGKNVLLAILLSLRWCFSFFPAVLFFSFITGIFFLLLYFSLRQEFKLVFYNYLITVLEMNGHREIQIDWAFWIIFRYIKKKLGQKNWRCSDSEKWRAKTVIHKKRGIKSHSDFLGFHEVGQ